MALDLSDFIPVIDDPGADGFQTAHQGAPVNRLETLRELRSILESEAPQSAVKYVSADAPNDLNSGASWSSAFLTIEAAIDALPTVAYNGNIKMGSIRIGPGEFEPSVPLDYAARIAFYGSRQAAGISDGQGTSIKMPDNFDDHLFRVDPNYTGQWHHQVGFHNLLLDGNKTNQLGQGTTPFIDLDASVTLTFDAAGKTITRSAGSWITDGWTAGDPARVKSTADNNGTFTIASGGVAATVLTVEEALTDEGPINSASIYPSPHDLVDMERGGFGTVLSNVFLFNGPGAGMNVREHAVNLLLQNVTAGGCDESFLSLTLAPGATGCQLSIAGTCQVDNCGPTPILLENRSTGDTNQIHIHSAEFEDVGGIAATHDSIIQYHEPINANPMGIVIGSLNALKTVSGPGSAVIHILEGSGGATPHCVIYGMVGANLAGSYDNIIQDDELTISLPAGTNPQGYGNRPVFYGPYGNARGSIGIGQSHIHSGGGNPENNIVGEIGDLYLRTDGSAGFALYVKEADAGLSTGWQAAKIT